MTARIALAVILLWALSHPAMRAEDVVVPLLNGEVFADGRPIDRVVEVRLEAHNSALIANAYTFGSAKFTFRNIPIVPDEIFYLVIKENGFKELRQDLRIEDFVRDTASPYILHAPGSIVLNLESLPPEKKAGEGRISGPKGIDARQLQAEISDKARRAYDLALHEIAAGNSKAALKDLEQAVEMAPEYYDALNRLGAEYLRTGQNRKAEAMLDRARVLNPNDPLPLINLGILHFEEANRLASEASYRTAAGFFEKALRLEPLAPRTSFYLGASLYKVGAFEKAEPLFLNALALDNRMHEARLMLINLYTRQRRYDAVLKQIAEYLEAEPNTPQKKQLEALRTQIESSLRR